MNTMFAAMLGGWEIVLILAVVLILFGARKLPELAKGLGQGIKEFKKATRDVSEEITHAMDEDTSYTASKKADYPPQKELPSGGGAETASTVPHSTEHKS
jgi:sec-independent protein translocase protein TatA